MAQVSGAGPPILMPILARLLALFANLAKVSANPNGSGVTDR
jgi:hypothetical protein